ncbi:MAG: EAL domain-containing protein [Lachnospiraceae bacterium]|nr:EAL domain-containing protein [Lachnospiraceae bacterium]
MQFNIYFEMCSLVFLALFTLFSSGHGGAGYRSTLFNVLVGITALSITLDILSCYAIAYIDKLPLWGNYFINTAFLVVQLFVPFIVVFYISVLIQRMELGLREVLIMLIPALIGVVLLVANLWTGIIYYFDGQLVYTNGPMHSYLYLNAAVYLGEFSYFIITSWSELTKYQRHTSITIVGVCFMPTLIMFFIPNVMLAGVGLVMAVFVIIMTGENMMVYDDQITGVLNRTAFAKKISENSLAGIPLQIFAIALDNFKIVNDMYGIEKGNDVLRQLGQAFIEEFGDRNVFRIEGGQFCISLEEKTESVREKDRIDRIMRKRWKISTASGTEYVELGACVGLVHTINYPGADIDTVMKALSFGVNKAKQAGNGEFFEVDESSTKDMTRRSAIEQAIQHQIDAGSFEVHYQPIYDVQSGRFHSMEALARLNVPGYGYVSPEEFVLIAEQDGTIVKIGLLVLEEVCRFFKTSRLKEKGIDFVEVNLSVVQTMQDSIHDDVEKILKKYDLNPRVINLEITETAAAYSEKKLIQNMARIALMGVTFSLDDYGSGYSNVNYLVDLPFEIVKIDKHIVWTAMKKSSTRRILANTLAMFKDINLKIVTEGIENKKMMDMVVSMGADYLQGYMFSKPVPKEKLLLCLEPGYLDKVLKD